MKSRNKQTAVRGVNRGLVVAGLAPGMMLGLVEAQEILVPPVEFRDRVTTVEQASTNWIGSATAPPLQAPAAGPRTKPLEAGPVRFHPHLGYQVIYGDGVLRRAGDPSTTVIHTVSPGMFLELGRHWSLDFTASINRYSNASDNDSEGYYLALRGRIPREKWLLDFGYVGSVTDVPQLETAAQTLQNSHLVTASGIYNYQTRLSLELSATMDARLAQNFTDYWTWSTLEWLNYQATAKTTVSLGAGAGYNLVDPGPDSTFEQLQARAVWLAASKLSLQATAGVQFQQFMGEDSSGQTNAASGTQVFPIFGASVAYRPFEQTSLSLSASHTIGNAYEENRFSETTAVNLGLRQRLFGQVSLDVVPGYNFRKFKSSLRGLSVQREDEYLSLFAGLSAVLFKKLNVVAFYQYGDSAAESNLPGVADGFNFHFAQVGLRLDYRY